MLIFLSVIAYGGILKSHYEPPKYPLRVCPALSIDRATMYEAVEWWSDHDVWFVVDWSQMKEAPADCIVIHWAPSILDDGILGMTLWGVGHKSALIEIGDPYDALTIAHELGHAAGYGHTPLGVPGELMAKKHVGWSDRGMKIHPSP